MANCGDQTLFHETCAPKDEGLLTGHIVRISYADDQTGYAVLAVKSEGHRQPQMAAGILPAPVIGEELRLFGQPGLHKKYGLRFNFTSFERYNPKTVSGLKKYLGSGLIKGIGPVLADRLVERFGEKVLDVLDENPERLTEVSGLGAGRREAIVMAWQQNAGIKRLLNFLAKFSLGPALAAKLMKQYGAEAEKTVKEDPYALAYEVEGIGFLTADKIARNLGFEVQAPQRLKAALIYALHEAVLEGHVFLPGELLFKKTSELAGEVERSKVEEALSQLLLQGRIIPEKQGEPGLSHFYLPHLYEAERYLETNIKALLKGTAALEIPEAERAILWAEKQLQLDFSPGQKEAILRALKEKVLIITGGPGTGKTTITKAITLIYQAMKARLALVAPTGRAAKRLSQATGLAAKTIHRLLEYSAAARGFIRGPHNKLELDLLIVDEASMLDLILAQKLTAALEPQTILIFIGDADQLPPIGPGQVLEDLMKAKLPTVRLLDIYRQGQNSLISKAAQEINLGRFPQSGQGGAGDFYFMPERDTAQILAKILKMITTRLPQKLSLNPLADIQVLTPVHQGELGTEKFNSLLSEHLNPEGRDKISRFGRQFKVGDKVLQLKNNYEREVFNGDLGFVSRIDHESQELFVNFDEGEAAYDFKDLDELSLAYAMTIHKAQGSEFPAVIIPLSMSHYVMLKRNLIYTALTRARRFAVIIGSEDALNLALKNSQRQVRFSKFSI